MCHTVTTLARDVKILSGRGFLMTHLGIMDMFPHTAHVESMALFVKEEAWLRPGITSDSSQFNLSLEDWVERFVRGLYLGSAEKLKSGRAD